MPTDAQRRTLASAHHAEVQGLKEKITQLGQQLAEARKDCPPAVPDDVCDAVALALDDWARDVDPYDYGLPIYDDGATETWRTLIRSAFSTNVTKKATDQ